MAAQGLNRSEKTGGDTPRVSAVPEDREYDNPAHARLDEAVSEAITAAEAAECTQLASELTSQLGYLYAVHGR